MSQHLEQTAPATSTVPNHMRLAVIATIFFPTGAWAIYYANRVKALAASGEEAAALEMARKVRQWSWASIIVGTIFAIVCTYYLIKLAYSWYGWLEQWLGLQP